MRPSDDRLRSLIDAGAMGYLMKQTASNELVEAIRHTRRGNQVFSPAISQRIRAQRAGSFMEGGNVSTLVAYDPVKQEIRWRVPVGNSRFGGTLSTASNLLFQVAPDGRLIAYSAEKGEQLLELPTGLRSGMGPPITFTIEGKQYIALMGGTGGTQSLGTTNPGAVITQQKPMLLVFGLDGKAELPKPGAGPAPVPTDVH